MRVVQKPFSVLLLKVPLGEVGRIRMTPDKQPSLIDAIYVIFRSRR